MLKSAALALVLGGSLFASGTSTCADAASSGCGQWWTSYSYGSAGDGAYNRSLGVSSVYTSNYTNVAASQDSLTSVFNWTSSYSGSVVTNSNISPWLSTSSTLDFDVAFTENPFTSYVSTSTTQAVYTNNVASTLPTNTSTSVSTSVYTSGGSAYENYLASVYALAYGNSSTSTSVAAASPVTAFADVIAPEPSTYVGVGLGIAAILFQARRRMAKRK